MPNTAPVTPPPRNIRLLVIHCSATPNDRTLFSGKFGTPGFRSPVHEIDLWHKQREFHRDTYWRGRQNASLEAIGYHYVIARNAALFTGRHEDEVGAHAQGWNSLSLGICLIGTDQFTALQWAQLSQTVRGMAARLKIPLQAPKLTTQGKQGLVVAPGICGHRDLPGHNKACPGFDVHAWLANDLTPPPGALA